MDNAPTPLTVEVYVLHSLEWLLGTYWLVLVNILASFCGLLLSLWENSAVTQAAGKFWGHCRKWVEAEIHLEPQDLNGCLRKLRGSRKVVLRMRFFRNSGLWWGYSWLFQIKNWDIHQNPQYQKQLSWIEDTPQKWPKPKYSETLGTYQISFCPFLTYTHQNLNQ